MEPFSWAILAIMAISAGVQYDASVKQSKARKQQAEYNNEVAKNEAVMMQREADSTARANERKKYNIRERGRRLRSSQEAMFAGSGITMQGTPLEILADTTLKQNEDILNIKRSNDAFQMTSNYKRENLLSNGNFMLSQARKQQKISDLASGAQLGLDLVSAGGKGAKRGAFGKKVKTKTKNWVF